VLDCAIMYILLITERNVYVRTENCKSSNIISEYELIFFSCIGNLWERNRFLDKLHLQLQISVDNTLTKGKCRGKVFPLQSGVVQTVGRGIALLFHDRGTSRGWVVSSTPWPHSTPGKDPVPILQEAGWAPGSVWTGGISRLHREWIPDRSALSQSLYRLSYRAYYIYICSWQIFSSTVEVKNKWSLFPIPILRQCTHRGNFSV